MSTGAAVHGDLVIHPILMDSSFREAQEHVVNVEGFALFDDELVAFGPFVLGEMGCGRQFSNSCARTRGVFTVLA